MATTTFRGGYEFDPKTYSDQRSGLLGRLQELLAEQGQYQPVAGASEPAPGPSLSQEYRQLSRLPNGRTLLPAGVETPAPPTQTVSQFEADLAQQAREVAAARAIRGVRSTARAEARAPDTVDIAKSVGIGAVNGAVNMAGLAMGEIPTGFGFLPDNFAQNTFNAAVGLPKLPSDHPDYFKSWRPDELRHWLEGYTGEFYKPKTPAGRFAETIGEFLPAVVGGAGAAAAFGRTVAPLLELPSAIAKHAVAPGIAVQSLKEMFPESPAGEILQKAYPVAKRVLPTAFAVQRYFGR